MISRDTFRNEWTGFATDDWSMNNPCFKYKIENGDTGFEMDTTKVKMFNAVSQTWVYIN